LRTGQRERSLPFSVGVGSFSVLCKNTSSVPRHGQTWACGSPKCGVGLPGGPYFLLEIGNYGRPTSLFFDWSECVGQEVEVTNLLHFCVELHIFPKRDDQPPHFGISGIVTTQKKRSARVSHPCDSGKGYSCSGSSPRRYLCVSSGQTKLHQ